MAKLNFEPILEDLAKGAITAEEASRRIEELKQVAALAAEAEQSLGGEPPSGEREASDEQGSDAPRVRPGGLERVRIQATGRRVRIEGDPGIATLSVEGQHVLRRSGTVMEITANGELGPRFEGFSLIRPPRTREHLSDIALGKELVVKVNPKLLVDVDLTTGALRVEKMPRLGRIRVTAAGCTIEDVTEVQDLLAQAGGVTVEGPISKGRSRLRVESGSLTVVLKPGANVAVTGDAKVGRISWPSESSDVDEYVVGNGAARLQLSVVMGMATLKVEEGA
ncbi:hypothetical protein [uncultured Tessaracoccus sp.]|uniref:hypothetical protein n=1 Tax=uncultured Tessaracoccus sp. TaxID=905023 RepID=UPI0025E76DF1|nr:hypothetical protein [uncultured Tessaracoccus sp.]